MKQVWYKKIDVTNPAGMDEFNEKLRELQSKTAKEVEIQMRHADTRFVYVMVVYDE